MDVKSDEFLDMVATIESYLLRRAVCDCETSVLAPFTASLIARLDAVRNEGGNVAEALQAMLLNEAGTPRRFPTDAEFAERAARYDYCRPFTKESLLYRELFEQYYPGQARMIVDFWMPNRTWPGCDVDDPSARVLSNYGASGV